MGGTAYPERCAVPPPSRPLSSSGERGRPPPFRSLKMFETCCVGLSAADTESVYIAKQEKKEEHLLNALPVTLHSSLALAYKACPEVQGYALNITHNVPPAIFAFLKNGTQQRKKGKQVLHGSKVTHHDPLAIVASLKDCTTRMDLVRGSRIHCDLIGYGLPENNVVIGSTLVNMYAKCGALSKAQQVFNQLCARNVVTWNILISAYIRHGYGMKALDCFEQMQTEGHSPNSVTFLCLLKACVIIESADKGLEIHHEIAMVGLLEHELVVANALIDMYTKLGQLAKAQDVFDKLPTQDVVSWNTLILGYAQHGHPKVALSLFDEMQRKGISPSTVTFLSVLRACASVGDGEKGEEIHVQIAMDAFLEEDIVVGTALVDMYGKCGLLAKAQGVFNKLSVRNLVSWTALITAYAQHGHEQEALDCFKQMKCASLSPNDVTFISVLKACSSIRASKEGQEIHAQIVKEGLSESNVFVGTALLDMYGNCGLLAEAQSIFDRFELRDVISWNALISGYAQHVHDGEEALKCFERMQLEGFAPDAVTFVGVLKACGNTGNAYKGQDFHAEIAQNLSLEGAIVGTALLDMYTNCGMLAEAQQVFDSMGPWDVVSWNTLIAGYAQLGKDEVVFNLLEKMLGEGSRPDVVTFTILFNSCSHTGQLNRAQCVWESMNGVYGMTPVKEQYTCMVDLFGRAGLTDKAIAVAQSMPFSVCRVVWQILLTACRNLGNTKVRELAFRHAALSDEWNGEFYVCMGDLSANCGKQEMVGKILDMDNHDDNLVYDVS